MVLIYRTVFLNVFFSRSEKLDDFSSDFLHDLIKMYSHILNVFLVKIYVNIHTLNFNNFQSIHGTAIYTRCPVF